MTYRVYSGPPGAATIRPMEQERCLYKEFVALDEAVGWARHLDSTGRVAVLIEGDDGTRLDRNEIRAAVARPDLGAQSAG